ncbi:hypothetical protein AEGHOMDF_4863 [Methylobacterium soli]|nr:hypothetical protein AEGHOMDF_4863 [Methylobacterium soli]
MIRIWPVAAVALSSSPVSTQFPPHARVPVLFA